MHLHRNELVIVQPRPAHFGVVDGKAQRFDQVQRAAGIGAQPDDIAGVGRDFGLDENDVEHGGQASPEGIALRAAHDCVPCPETIENAAALPPCPARSKGGSRGRMSA